MKRHISIFALLLSAFTAVGLAGAARSGTQNVLGGYYYIEEGPLQGPDSTHMSIDGTTDTLGTVEDGHTLKFRATPGKGMEIFDWARSFGHKDPWKFAEKLGIKEDTCIWEGDSTKGADGYLMVRFDYIRFVITFNTNGGTPEKINDITGQKINSTIELPTVEKVGYGFAGWKNAKGDVFPAGDTSGEVFWYDDEREFYADLTAQWMTNKYMVTFDANGGDTPVPTTKEVTYDSPYGELATCTRAGYTFDGWYTTKEGGVPITAESPVRITENQTLYAHWTAIAYDVELVLNGGKFPEGDKPLKITTKVDKVFSVAAPERENWVFAGWTVVKVPEESSYDGAKWGTEPDETENDVRDKTTKCQNGARGAVYFKNLTFDSNVQVFLKATWQGQERKISTTASPAEAGTTVPEEMIYTEGDEAMLKADSNDGWSFKCWQLDGQDVSDRATYSFTVKEDADYVAVFTGKVVKISFRAFNASPGEQQYSYTHGLPYEWLPTVTPDDPNYQFDGWYDNDDFEGDPIKTTDTVNATDDKFKLYAKCSERSDFIVVYADPSFANAWITNTPPVAKGTKISDSDVRSATWNWPENRDYKYWIKKWNPELPVTVMSDTTITAVWESYADVLDCPNLAFDVRANWFVDTTPGFSKKGDSCLKLTDIGDGSVSVKVAEPGEFAFYWKSGSTETKLQVDKTENAKKESKLESLQAVDFWTPVTVRVSDASADNPAEIKFLPDKTAFDGYLALDAVTWTPGAAPQTHTIDVVAGEHGGVAKSPVKDRYDEDDSVTLTATADPGYAFCCWTNDTGFATNENPWAFKVVEDAAYTATFTACVYRVTLNQSGGEGGVTEVQATFGEAMPELESLPQLAHNTFLGYFDAATDGKKYYNADGTSAATWDKTTGAELFAQWSEDGKIVITVASGDPARGTASGGGSYYAGDNVMISATPNAGYAFQRWSDGSTAANFEIRVTTNASYTATFTACVYRVTFDANGGVQPTPETKDVTFNEKYGTLAETSRSGYDFAGWWTKQSGGAEVTADSVFTTAGDQTLYAHWDEDIGELSRILDCNNLRFVPGSVDGWTKCTDFSHKGDSCLRSTTANAEVKATITQPGTLTFWWRGFVEEKGLKLQVLGGDTEVDAYFIRTSDSEELNDKWFEGTAVSVTIDVVPVVLTFRSANVGEYCAIDDVTWTPDGKEPEYAKNDTPVTGFSMADGKIGFSFAADGSSTYHIFGTNDVTAPWPWPFVREIEAGETQPVQIDIKADEPKMFYRIRALMP